MADKHDERYFDLAAAYVLEALEGNDLADFQSHLKKGCRVCTTQIVQFDGIASLLSLGLKQVPVPTDLRSRVQFSVQLVKVAENTFQPEDGLAKKQEIENRKDVTTSQITQQKAQGSQQRWLVYGLTFAGIVMIAGFVAYLGSLLQTIREQDEYIISQRIQIATLKNSLSQYTDLRDILESPSIEIVPMDGTTANPGGNGQILWDPVRRNMILYAENLPPLYENERYHLWAISGQLQMSIHMFTVRNEEERRQLLITHLMDSTASSKIEAFSVTREFKESNSQHSEGPYLYGKVPAK